MHVTDRGVRQGCTSLSGKQTTQTRSEIISPRWVADVHTWTVVWRTHLVEAQCLRVRLQSLLVVFLPLLYEAEDVPAYVRGEIEPNALLYKLETLVPASKVGEDEALHA